eukprot:Hpha_TRINITY_DN6048_c0_g1::TRINITY_DN6048_c0_g1_i1::g.63542::m.63542
MSQQPLIAPPRLPKLPEGGIAVRLTEDPARIQRYLGNHYWCARGVNDYCGSEGRVRRWVGRGLVLVEFRHPPRPPQGLTMACFTLPAACLYHAYDATPFLQPPPSAVTPKDPSPSSRNSGLAIVASQVPVGPQTGEKPSLGTACVSVVCSQSSGTEGGVKSIGLQVVDPRDFPKLKSPVHNIIVNVTPGSDAAAAGLTPGLTIRSVFGNKVDTVADLGAALEDVMPGDTIPFEVEPAVDPKAAAEEFSV